MAPRLFGVGVNLNLGLGLVPVNPIVASHVNVSLDLRRV
jgi:hypothetical protein